VRTAVRRFDAEDHEYPRSQLTRSNNLLELSNRAKKVSVSNSAPPVTLASFNRINSLSATRKFSMSTLALAVIQTLRSVVANQGARGIGGFDPQGA